MKEPAQADFANAPGGMPPAGSTDAAGNRRLDKPDGAWDGQLDPACWAAALAEAQAAEERARASFPGGKPFPIPDSEYDLTDIPPSGPAGPEARYYAVNGRPVKLVPTADGGLDVQALNMRTGEFERAMGYLSRCISCEGDVDAFADEAAFLVQVGEIRAHLGIFHSQSIFR